MAAYTDLHTSPVQSRVQRFDDAAYLIVRNASGPDTYTALPKTDPATQLPVGSYVILTDPAPLLESHIPKDRTPGGWRNTDPSNYDITTGLTSIVTFLAGLTTWDTSYDTLT